MKQKYVSQFGENFEAYPPHTLRMKDETWEAYVKIKNGFGKNHNYAMEQLINNFNNYGK
jgi:hypothetical protein